MTFLKNKTLNDKFFNAIRVEDFAAQNCTCDITVPSKQVFITFRKEKKINVAEWCR